MSKHSGDYRIFVGAFPTGPMIDRLQALRARHDPKTARITAPHVTLAGTYWRLGPAGPENEAETMARLGEAQAQLPPFELQLGGVRAFGWRVIYLAVAPTAELMAVRQTLLQAIGPDKHRHFTPHLTLTMRLNKQPSQTLLAELQRSEWHTGRWSMPINQLWLMQRGPDDPAWRYIQQIDINYGHDVV